jgi:hypothetical protein
MSRVPRSSDPSSANPYVRAGWLIWPNLPELSAPRCLIERIHLFRWELTVVTHESPNGGAFGWVGVYPTRRAARRAWVRMSATLTDNRPQPERITPS